MSDKMKDSSVMFETRPIPGDKSRPNGSQSRSKPKNTTDPLPDINIRALVEERNWSALAGLSLIGLGLLYVAADVLNITFALWAWLLLGAGGWLMVDAGRKYDAAGRLWVGNTRNRMAGGAMVAAIGLLGAMHINWWGLMLLGAGGWLGYDTWQTYQNAGRVWTAHTRNRMFAAGVVMVIGFFGLIPLWSTWPLLVITIGVVMLYRRGGGKTCG